MAATVEQKSTNDTCTNECNRADSDQSNSPCGEQVGDSNICLLVSVCEVIVSGAHVVIETSVIHLVQTAIKVFSSSIQFHAVVNIGLGGIGVISIGGEQSSVRIAESGIINGLVQHGHSLSEGFVGEELVIGREPLIGSRQVLIAISLHDVASIGLISSLASISGRILITASPLEVNVIVVEDTQTLRNEIILGGRVGLHNVASLPAHVDVVDLGKRGHRSRSRGNVEDKASVLEGSSVLSGIQSQLVRETIEGNYFVLGYR